MYYIFMMYYIYIYHVLYIVYKILYITFPHMSLQPWQLDKGPMRHVVHHLWRSR